MTQELRAPDMPSAELTREPVHSKKNPISSALSSGRYIY